MRFTKRNFLGALILYLLLNLIGIFIPFFYGETFFYSIGFGLIFIHSLIILFLLVGVGLYFMFD